MNRQIPFLYVLAALVAAFLLPVLAFAAPGMPAPDPTVDATGYAAAVRDAFAAGRYVFALVLGLWGLGRVMWSLRDKIGFLASAKTRALLTGGTGVLVALGASLAAGGGVDWAAVLGAIAVAVGLYMTPEPKAKPA